MKNRRNYYRVLQIQPDAPFAVIRASYRTLLRELKLHPDFGGDHWNAQTLNEAYAILSNSEKRQEYDKKLFERYTKKSFTPTEQKTPLITLFCPFCKRPLARKALPDERCPTCQSPLQSLGADDLEQRCRRSVSRRKKSATIRYFTTWPQKGRSAEMMDVSPQGMRFRCSEKLSTRSVIKISGPLLKAIAEVKNSHKIFIKGKKVYSVGVQFLSVTFFERKGCFYSASA